MNNGWRQPLFMYVLFLFNLYLTGASLTYKMSPVSSSILSELREYSKWFHCE